MITFIQAYKDVYNPVMTANGFARKGNIYHRLYNGKIIQLLSYTSFGDNCYTIQFEIYPLCSGYESETFIDGERLSELLGMEYEWEYKNDEYLQQLPESLSLCQKHIFPYFDNCVDYRSYFENTIKLHPGRYSRIVDKAIFYDIFLVLGNYEMAQKSMEARIERTLGAWRNNWGTETHPSPSKQKEFEQMRDSYYLMKEAMDKNDREYIEAYINKNEEYSLESYIETFQGKRAYKKYMEIKQSKR
ncbi:MAG: hypothetical protein FWH52_03205 [Synergistaceae bacterium]|nr:hypothetical protein [Synergistaceae bacterium]